MNTHEICCDALTLVPNSAQISHVALPKLCLPDLLKMQRLLAGLIQGMRLEVRPCGTYEAVSSLKWDQEMPDLLGQLWECIAEPILRHLDVSLWFNAVPSLHSADCRWSCCMNQELARCLTLHGV